MKSNQTCVISAILGERERGVSSGSGEALVGSTQTGAVRESGHGRGTPRGGTGRSNRGTLSSLCFDLFFSSSCPINLSSPPFPSNSLRSTCHFITSLFIYMKNYINKYCTLSLFSHPSDCYLFIYLFYPLYFCL